MASSGTSPWSGPNNLKFSPLKYTGPLPAKSCESTRRNVSALSQISAGEPTNPPISRFLSRLSSGVSGTIRRMISLLSVLGLVVTEGGAVSIEVSPSGMDDEGFKVTRISELVEDSMPGN